MLVAEPTSQYRVKRHNHRTPSHNYENLELEAVVTPPKAL